MLEMPGRQASLATLCRLADSNPRAAFNDRTHATTRVASRKIPVEPVTERAGVDDPGNWTLVQEAAQHRLSLPLFSAVETAARLLHLGVLAPVVHSAQEQFVATRERAPSGTASLFPTPCPGSGNDSPPRFGHARLCRSNISRRR